MTPKAGFLAEANKRGKPLSGQEEKKGGKTQLTNI